MTVSFWTTTALAGTGRLNSWRARGRAGLSRFRADESGVLQYPMFVTLICMLAVLGIGVDLVRLERDRTHVQYALDRAVLAAADLDQELEPAAVVQDYMSKSGVGEYYRTPDAQVTPTSKRVSASVDADFDPEWMQVAGVKDPLPLYAAATAEESIGNVEISLVLDVSGSMRSNNRLVNLKRAAKEFVQTMSDNTEDDKMSMSIVPYSTQVSMPAQFLDQLSVEDAHDVSYCLNFDSGDFSTTSLSTLKTYERTMHFSIWSTSDQRDRNRHVYQPICASHDDNPERTTILLEDDVDTLQDYIDDFDHSENTSLDIGMKWGVALLDPSVQPIISTLTVGEDALVDAKFASRPTSYSDTDTLKVVVLMTDGQNTHQPRVNDSRRSGNSEVWYNEDADVYSTYNPQRSYNKYYWHNKNRWMDHPYGNGSYEDHVCTGTVYNGYCYYGSWQTVTVDEPGTAEELSFAALFADTPLQYIYYYLFNDWMNFYDARDEWYYDVYNSVGASAKNTRTQAICTAAKEAGIIVFTIGFEAPYGGQEVLRQCASSDSHYYDVDGLEISDAFASIASAIRQLRLTE